MISGVSLHEFVELCFLYTLISISLMPKVNTTLRGEYGHNKKNRERVDARPQPWMKI